MNSQLITINELSSSRFCDRVMSHQDINTWEHMGEHEGTGGDIYKIPIEILRK